MTEPCGGKCGKCGSSAEHRPHPAEHRRIVDISASQRGKKGGRNDVAVAKQAVTGGSNKSSTRHPAYFGRHRVRADRVRGQRPPKEKCERRCDDAHYNPRRARTPCVEPRSEAHETGKDDADTDSGKDEPRPLILVAPCEDRHHPSRDPNQHEGAGHTRRKSKRKPK